MGTEKISVSIDSHQLEKIEELSNTDEYQSRSAVVRDLIDLGMKYEEVRNEKEQLQKKLEEIQETDEDVEDLKEVINDQKQQIKRLKNEKQKILEQREENQELVEFAEKQKTAIDRREEIKNRPIWKRAKYWILGRNSNK